jgi:hypothetical protein
LFAGWCIRIKLFWERMKSRICFGQIMKKYEDPFWFTSHF